MAPITTGKLNIAIVGAGMGGLAAAAALRLKGIHVTVYEQAKQFARVGAGIQIGCNAMHVLRGLGLEARLRGDAFYRARGTTAIGRRARSCST
jgi:salicylate hydroxylase/6-hydroxynicotinate 3-monooxygenase